MHFLIYLLQFSNNFPHYQHKDLKFHGSTGYNGNEFGEAPGYFRTWQLAEETLQAYLESADEEIKERARLALESITGKDSKDSL